MKKQIDLLERMVAEIHAKLFPEQYAPGPSIAPPTADRGTQETAENEEAVDKGAEHQDTAAQLDYSSVRVNNQNFCLLHYFCTLIHLMNDLFFWCEGGHSGA